MPLVGDKPCRFKITPDIDPQAIIADVFVGKRPVTLNTTAINRNTTQVMYPNLRSEFVGDFNSGKYFFIIANFVHHHAFYRSHKYSKMPGQKLIHH